MAWGAMRKRLLSILSSNKGRAITWAASAGVAVLAGQAARVGLEITPETQAWLTTSLTAVIGAVVDGWTSSVTASGVEDIQRQLQLVDERVEVDAWAGENTKGAVVQIVAENRQLKARVKALESVLGDIDSVTRGG